MPAHRVPTELLEVQATRTEIDRTHEPQAGGVGAAPEHLSSRRAAIWDEIVGTCAPGVFQSSDRILLEVIAGLVERMRDDPRGFGVSAISVLQGLLCRCGMTPSDRSRVYVAKPSDAKKPKTGLASFRR